MRRLVRQGVFASGVALLAAASAVGAQELNWSGSLGYAAGSYIFSEPYRTFSLLNSLTLRAGRLELSGSLPVVAQNGTAVSLVAGIPLPTGGPESAAVQRRRQGQTIEVRGGRRDRASQAALIGLAADSEAESLVDSTTVSGSDSYLVKVADPMFSASLGAYEGIGFVRSLNVEGWVKAPIASVASGVGTGAWDYGAGLSLATGLGKSLIFANATWWVLGDLPELKLRDALFYSLAIGRPIGGAWSMLASASASTRIVTGSDPPASVSLLVSRRFSSGPSLSVGLGAGISESSSAFTASIGWSTTLLGKRQ